MYLEFLRTQNKFSDVDVSDRGFQAHHYYSAEKNEYGIVDSYFADFKIFDDGRYLIVTHDKKKHQLVVTVDAFGFVKGYIKVEKNRIIVTTDPNIIYRNSKSFNALSLRLYWLLGFVPAPESLYEGWTVIPQGEQAVVNLNDGSISFKKWFYFTPSNKSHNHSISEFNSLFEQTVKQIQGNKSSVGLMLSGGKDSRLIASAINDPKSYFLKINGFVPDENDAAIISSYPKDLKGNHTQFPLSLDDENVIKCFIDSTVNACDHAHMGRWKFLYLLQKIQTQAPDDLLLNGQTADTLLMKNITGNNLSSRCLRSLYSSLNQPLNFTSVKLILQLLESLLPKSMHSKKAKLTSLVNYSGSHGYYLGYLLNSGNFPGLIDSHKVQLETKVGQKGFHECWEWLEHSLMNPLISTYLGQADFLMAHFLLSTFIWGLDARGIEDGCRSLGIRSRFVFMTKEIANFIVNIPLMKNKPFGEYKHYFDELLRARHVEKGCSAPVGSGFDQLENALYHSAFGRYFSDISKEKRFSEFIEKLNDNYQLSLFHLPPLMKNPKPQIIGSETFIEMYRLVSLYLWDSELSKSRS